MPARQRLFFLITIVALLLLVIVGLVYRAGVARGRRELAAAAATASAEETELAALAVIAEQATEPPTNTPLPSDTPLPTATPLPSSTPTPTESATPTETFTPTTTFTPTQTRTPTPLPASVVDWALSFRNLAVDGLNTISDLEFTPDRAAALLRRIAQEQSLVFVPVSLFEIPGSTWAVLLAPRTPDGEVIPTIFWRDPNDGNRIHGQLLRAKIGQLGSAGGRTAAEHLVSGVAHGAIQLDNQGRLQILFIENERAGGRLSAYVLAQSQPASDFDFAWWSFTDPLWDLPALGSEIELLDGPIGRLPRIAIQAPLPVRGPLRDAVNAPATFVEQPPFARQWARTVWSAPPRAADASRGYRFASGEVTAAPLATLAQILTLLRASNVTDASELVTRVDILQQIDDLGLTQPAAWLGYYLDNRGNRLIGDEITNRLRIFDNANRSRTFDAIFEDATDAEGAELVYRLAALQSVSEQFGDDALVTPAPPIPTLPPTPTATAATASSDLTSSRTVTDVLAALQAITNTLGSPITGPGVTLPAAPQVELPTETPTATGTPTNTPRPTVTPTATPSGTPTETMTPLPTATPSITPTPTETAVPLPIPDIPPAEAPLVTGQVINGPSNLRGGPGTEFVSLTGVPAFTDVDLFGLTVAGDWVLVRINRSSDANDGTIGWVAINLLRWNSDISVLPLFRADGTPLIPFTPTPTPTEGAPTPTHTPTPLITPAITEPSTGASLDGDAAPPPEANEIAATIAGENIPAKPLTPLTMKVTDNRSLRVDVTGATVEIWGGLFGQQGIGWVSAPAELLWAGAEVYVLGAANGDNGTQIAAQRVRIVAGPDVERVGVRAFDAVAQGLQRNSLMALLGSREESGVFLLENVGTLQQMLAEEQDASWVSGDEVAGILLRAPLLTTGRNSFSWLRTDGSGLRIEMQPFHNLSGVAGDAYGGIWWIETPQADLDEWQLWHYDPVAEQVVLRLQASGTIFRPGDDTLLTVVPVLLSAQPVTAGDPSTVTFIVDTQDKARLRPFTGVYSLVVNTADGANSTVDEAQLLLARDTYRGPLIVSPNRNWMTYFVYNADHPSLTSGLIRPANQLYLLALSGVEAGESALVYEAESRFEFLAPNVAWHGDDRLLLARSRFAAGDVFGLDRFGLVVVRLLNSDGQRIGGIETSSYLLPNQQELRDFAPCRNDEFTLMVTRDDDGNLLLARWDGTESPSPIFGIPINLSRTFVCWQGSLPS